MSVLAKPMLLSHIHSVEKLPNVKCMCCKREERASEVNITKTEWLHAANRVGWRAIEAEQFSFESVCPECVDSFMSDNVKEAV
ncbi:hypothetical protein J8L98_02110 [Pseudoalteromonas sp. MMG013]|uniref:hypothetical protein n=1 Tax=Pseudoalteromonas sp. MMG013 TaxID=2822687 RepID=UPI001B384598|nr:hypothetical protein [Pseudoalteromonas sp. MMG013]MBQ4860486.1 hypothetical protein [Pseudoalteromonas sp. MMG013]